MYRIWLILLVGICMVPRDAQAQLRAEVVASGLSFPVALVPDPVFDQVLYVVERGGLVRVIHNGQVQPTPFADFRSEVSTEGERGLLGMAFSPDVASGRVFFNFSNRNGDIVIARARRAPSLFQIDPASRFDLRWPTGERVIRHPLTTHYGGHLAFGPDGYLYIGLGDGGSSHDADNNAQNPASLLGKMLRIDVNVDDADPDGYRVPPDNPFVDGDPIPALPEIWAFGLRNPWRYSFDDFGPGATGALLIADVGQHTREEVNYEPAGAGGRNYGWRIREGRIPTPGITPSPPAYEPLTDPMFDYQHEGRAVIGGYVYRGAALPAQYRGRYFFADFTTSRVWSAVLAVDPQTREAVVTHVEEHTAGLGHPPGGITAMGRDLHGELYLVNFTGEILKIVADVPAPGAPTNLGADVSGGTVVVQWAAPSDAQHITGYQLEAGTAPGLSDVGVIRVPGGQQSMTFTGVPDGVYYVRVRTLSGDQVGTPSDEVTVTVSGAGCSDIAPTPANLAASLDGAIVTLTWDVAGGAVTGFVIEAGLTSGVADAARIEVPANQRSFTVLAPPGTYFVRVRSRAGCAVSGPSHEVRVDVGF